MSEAVPVDLTNCDREPIHIPGSIQPHGCLLVLDRKDHRVRHHSANSAAILFGGERVIAGEALPDLFGAQAAHTIRNALARSQQASTPGLAMDVALGAGTVDIAAHVHEGNTILEFERCEGRADRASPLELTRSLVSRLAQAETFDQLIAMTVRLLRAMLGYDRVMVYRFLHDGAGQVIGEARRHDLDSFLNQHFPAADIPRQARELYRRNAIRVIADAGFVPVPLVPALEPQGKPIDLSFAHLRSVSPIHCEYLRNMGVAASMSISVLAGGDLWGLIACHHYTPRALTMAQRLSAEILGRFLSLQIEALEQRASFEATSRARRALDDLVKRLPPGGTVTDVLRGRLPDLAKLLPCDGIGVWVDDKWQHSGAAPPAAAVETLVGFLNAVSEGQAWSSHAVPAQIPALAPYAADLAGVLAVPLSRTPKYYLLFFRKEVAKTVEWGGDPNKPVLVGPHGDRLTPRKSFEIWREEVRGQSAPWTSADLVVAEAARMALLEIVLRQSEAMAEERRSADVRQKMLNSELNHRVKNILALIQSLVTRGQESAHSLRDYAKSLEGRVRALAFAHDQIARGDDGGSLAALFAAELAPYGNPATPRMRLEGPPIGLNSRAYAVMALIVHELATNAVKYGALSTDAGAIDIAWRLDAAGDCTIVWTERGGPPVAAPRRRGFGSIIINRSVVYDLEGRAQVDWPPAGMVATFVLPARNIVAAPAAARITPAPSEPASAQLLDGRSVLLVEDQFVIAIDAEAMLLQLGAKAVEAAATAEEALARLLRFVPDIAVLDVNLGAATSIPVAEELRRRGIPFIFATGYQDSIMIPPAFRTIPVVRKPYSAEGLAGAIRKTAARP